MHKPSISALNELAIVDLSQNDPMSRRPVVLQNIIQPTPNRSVAFFLSQDPSVDQIREPDIITSATHCISTLGLSPFEISRHIQFPPHESMKVQKDTGASDF
jgi:hypothetical protein